VCSSAWLPTNGAAWGIGTKTAMPTPDGILSLIQKTGCRHPHTQVDLGRFFGKRLEPIAGRRLTRFPIIGVANENHTPHAEYRFTRPGFRVLLIGSRDRSPSLRLPYCITLSSLGFTDVSRSPDGATSFPTTVCVNPLVSDIGRTGDHPHQPRQSLFTASHAVDETFRGCPTTPGAARQYG